MSDMFHIIIDGVGIKATPDMTIVEAAKSVGIEIPTLCHDKRIEEYGACGICVVEVEGVPKLLRACSTKVFNGMIVNTKSERVIKSRKFALDMLLSNHTGDCKAPCSLACPAGTDCQGYVGLIANGEYEEALKLIKKKIPLPAAIGRVCPHPCQTACRRSLVEDPIQIAYLKSFAADIDLESENTYVPELAPLNGKTVSVIGGGPAGLTAAYFLRIKGYSVKIYDKMPKMGGMLRYGIPQYRLPKELLDKEIKLIEDLGIEMVNNKTLGVDFTIDSLKAESDAVVVAVGAWKSSPMRVEGENLDGVYGGIDFLRSVIEGKPFEIGKKVAVCGGGNTAMDACRTAVRLGAEEVYVVYRRTRDEMPAEKLEIDEAEEEGVIYKFLTNPAEIIGADGKVKAVRLQVMELGEPDASGRRSPVPVEGKFEILDVDSVIMAIGQQTDIKGLDGLELTRKNTIVADESTFMTNIDGVFAVGDATNKGASIAVAAIGEAQKAADVIDSYINGFTVGYRKPFVVEKQVTAEDLAGIERNSAAEMPTLSSDERKHSFKEVALGFDKETAMTEASRCLECGCLDYFKCKLLKYSRMYDVNPVVYSGDKTLVGKDSTHPFIIHDNDKCILCGQCVRVCDEVMGVTALGLVSRGFATVVSPEFNNSLDSSRCISCGQCVALCPTGALEPKVPFKKNVPLDTKVTITVCTGCSKFCEMKVHTAGKTVVRCEPAENNILCKTGAFGFAALNNPDRVKTCTVDGEVVSRADALKAAASRMNNTVVLVNSSMSNEALEEAVSFAKENDSDIMYFNATDYIDAEIKVFGDERRFGANIAKIKSLGIEEYNGEKYESAVVFGGKVPEISCKLLAAEVFEKTDADIVLCAESTMETDCSFTTGSGIVTTKAIY
ncbi:MAG: FAD-dependent oxidoreductase [Clostridia bacterium]|nr:FAD-dependent oxidoreductase [Clostridia bacterium]